MKKISFLIFIAACLIACSGGRAKQESEFPIIDIIGNMGNFQRVYMSELFSSIELIPLETREDCLLDMGTFHNSVVNDSIIIMRGDNRRRLFAFDRTSGKFLNQIGGQGQGPREFIFPGCTFFNTDKPTVFVQNLFGRNILEYDFSGRYVLSFPQPKENGVELFSFSHLGDNLFIGSMGYRGDNEYKYFVFDHNGDIVQRFPNHIFFNKQGRWASNATSTHNPVRVDNRLYFRSSLNDTLFVFENNTLQPAYVFDFGRTLPIGYLETPRNLNNLGTIHFPNLDFGFIFVATPTLFFYDVRIPNRLSGQRQRIRPIWIPMLGDYRTHSSEIFGIYDIAQNRNILLDTDQHLQQGIVNDINGGLSFIPRFYAGNGEVVGIWNPEDMLEILTEEYFATKTIRDPEAHQRLREVLRNLVEDDNPVVVIAKLR
jgi:hypothetical protein